MAYKRHLLIFMVFALCQFFCGISKAKGFFLTADSTEQKYLADLKITGKGFSNLFKADRVKIYSMSESAFIAKMDSARMLFLSVLNRYQKKLSAGFIKEQEFEINYYIDRLLIEYPLNYSTYTGNKFPLISDITKKMDRNLSDFNNPDLLTKSDFTDYVKSFFAFELDHEISKQIYKQSDNKFLDAIFNLIPRFITNKDCIQFWEFDYLYNHIDNNGIKNIDNVFLKFKATCSNKTYLEKITTLYDADYKGRLGHLINTYKKVGNYQLDMHLFLPGVKVGMVKHPAIIYFYGGSWSEGKPDWFFNACKKNANEGWVACAIEYRTYGREATLPFEAVKDARSAIRWLRQHCKDYGIDPERIVAYGNSAGGHLALSCAMADKWNEKTDNLKYSSSPNAIIINSGVYDLTDRNTAWIRKDLTNKDLVKEISPNYLVRKNLPPILAIHGTADGNVPFIGAKTFEMEMLKAGNPIEFHAIENSGHFLWLDPRYSPKVAEIQKAFLKKWGY